MGTYFHTVSMACLQAGITENLLSYLISECLQTFAKPFFIWSRSLWAEFFSASGSRLLAHVEEVLMTVNTVT